MDSPLFMKEIYYNGGHSIVASASSIPKKNTQKVGHIASLLFDIDVTITKGTGTISGNILDAINNITILDKEGKAILVVSGAQLTRAKFLASIADSRDYSAFRRGRYVAATALADVGTAQNERLELPLNIRAEDQPLGVEFSINPLTSILSVVGTATATITIRVVAKTYKNPNVPFRTDRLFAYNTANTTINVKNQLKDTLPKRVLIQGLALQDDGNADDILDYITLTDNGVGLERIEDQDVEDVENTNFVSGHQAGFYILPVSPFQVTDTLEFAVEPNTATVYTVYVLHNGARN